MSIFWCLENIQPKVTAEDRIRLQVSGVVVWPMKSIQEAYMNWIKKEEKNNSTTRSSPCSCSSKIAGNYCGICCYGLKAGS